MANCKICGKSYGMFGGGEEPYTGHKLTVCNECGNAFKIIESLKKNDFQKCEEELNKLIEPCKNADIKNILGEYESEVLNKSKKLIKNQELEKEQNLKLKQVEEEFEERRRNFKSTTGYNFEGFNIVDYKGIVSGEVVLGTGFMSEFSASVSDLFGTQSNLFANKMAQAKQGALVNLIKSALMKDANALIGVDFDYITFNNNILGVSANGTAVVIEKIEE